MRKRSWQNAAVLYEGETDVFGVCATAMEVDVEPALVARLTASLGHIHVACTVYRMTKPKYGWPGHAFKRKLY